MLGFQNINNFFLAISHAHDDHIDDYFLEKYFNKDMNPGDAIIFDENGIHKGSKILENERIVLRFLFSPNHKN